MLIGNKIDLSNMRAITTEEGKQMAEANEMYFLETSALDNTNVKETFHQITEAICNAYTPSDHGDDESSGEDIYNMKTVDINFGN